MKKTYAFGMCSAFVVAATEKIDLELNYISLCSTAHWGLPRVVQWVNALYIKVYYLHLIPYLPIAGSCYKKARDKCAGRLTHWAACVGALAQPRDSATYLRIRGKKRGVSNNLFLIKSIACDWYYLYHVCFLLSPIQPWAQSLFA